MSLSAEISPSETITKDKDGKEVKVMADNDDGFRAETIFKGLAKLKPTISKAISSNPVNYIPGERWCFLFFLAIKM